MKKLYNFIFALFTIASTLGSPNAQANECVDAETIIPVANSTVAVAGSFLDATLSDGTTLCSATAVQDVWYQFTAISTRTRVKVATTVNATSLGFTLYKGNCESTPVTCVNDYPAMNFGSDSESKLFTDLEVGETYFIRAINFTGSNVIYPITVEIQTITPPANDLCANPTTLTSNLTFEGTQGTFANSGKELAAPSCYTTNYSQDVWYQFTALETVSTIEVKNLSIRSTIQLFNENCGSAAIACASSNSSGSNSKLVATNLVVGNTYKFRVVNSTGSLSSLSFNVGVTYVPTASNDLIENAITLTPNVECQNVTGTFSAATITGNGPSCYSGSTQDVWYTFIATEEMMRVNVGGPSGVDKGFELYKGTDATQLVACVNQAGLHVTEAYTSNSFEIGATYTVRVFNAGLSASTADFTICVMSYPTPTNDLCADATLITPNLECAPVIGTFSGATIPDYTVCTNAIQDIWYKFIATEPEMTISITGPEGLDHGFKVYEQTCGGNAIVCSNDNAMGLEEEAVLTDLTIGTTYYIQVFNATTINSGTFELCLIGSPTETCPSIVEISAASTICEGSEVTFNSSIDNGGNQPVYQWLLNGTSVGDNNPTLTLSSVNNNDIIQLVIISNATCAPTNAMAFSNEIIVSTQASVTPSFDFATSICKDATVVLPTTSLNGIEGTWSPVVNNQVTTTYTFTPIATAACATSTTKTIEVTGITGTVTVENKILSVQSNGTSFQWIDCTTDLAIDGATAATYAPSTPGAFAVVVTENNCEWTSECFSVSNVGITSIETSFSITPNPFNNKVTISSDVIGSKYTVLNTNGQVILAGNIIETTTSLDLSALAPGYYYITVGQQTQKLIKQ